MKKSFIFVSILIGVLMLSFVSAGWFTGNAIWGWTHCSSSNPCPAGEGDCDRDSDCQTGYCAQNVGANYGQAGYMDVCECPSGTNWDGTKCSSKTNLTGVTYQGILDMLRNCVVQSRLTNKQIDPNLTGDSHCNEQDYLCVSTFFSDVPNPKNPAFDLTNTLRVTCGKKYEGITNSYYIQSVCCSRPH